MYMVPIIMSTSVHFIIEIVESVNANLILRLATVDVLAVFSPSLLYI